MHFLSLVCFLAGWALVQEMLEDLPVLPPDDHIPGEGRHGCPGIAALHSRSIDCESSSFWTERDSGLWILHTGDFPEILSTVGFGVSAFFFRGVAKGGTHLHSHKGLLLLLYFLCIALTSIACVASCACHSSGTSFHHNSHNIDSLPTKP